MFITSHFQRLRHNVQLRFDDVLFSLLSLSLVAYMFPQLVLSVLKPVGIRWSVAMNSFSLFASLLNENPKRVDPKMCKFKLYNFFFLLSTENSKKSF